MKGIVFTEFLQMVEDAHDYELVDQIINDVDPESEGVYTAVGTYSHTEIVALVVAYAQRSEQEVGEVLRKFGHHLLMVFHKSYPEFFEPNPTAFDLFSSIDNYIHIEVAKLYPDAELPRFEINKKTSGEMVMTYTSERKMSDLALGLIEKTLEHYKEDANIQRDFLNEDGSLVRFTITAQ
ncbi:heme NO-binding domain-containing protein [Owenweeksia hongkongensis]|uniref:Heme NO binding protein n=1 Tax=Owenweeksia hongkongensis (strain DSM 17368 / CIP 108786 / JCM 12287 / NRRL B-23963 / UST20020801) TaxID=926562 RepID=G8R6C6_OWEHD|nr:heme NO-binding domain-containing protein [Owenweeksia hongkongensis]AEV33346.1 heme NO binding protein [Owenweeksia hongkongensis DSM 17368]